MKNYFPTSNENISFALTMTNVVDNLMYTEPALWYQGYERRKVKIELKMEYDGKGDFGDKPETVIATYTIGCYIPQRYSQPQKRKCCIKWINEHIYIARRFSNREVEKMMASFRENQMF